MHGDIVALMVIVKERELDLAKRAKFAEHARSPELNGGSIATEIDPISGASATIRFIADSVRGMLSRPARSSSAANTAA